jgi:TIR domain
VPPLNMTDVFVSHSSEDQPRAEAVVRLLTECIDFDRGEVVCTSVIGYGLDFGTPFERRLRKAIEASDVLISLVSKSSLASLFCTFEMGAAWGLDIPIKPVLLPGFASAKLKRPLSSMHYLEWQDELGWIKLVREVARITSRSLKNARLPPRQDL